MNYDDFILSEASYDEYAFRVTELVYERIWLLC